MQFRILGSQRFVERLSSYARSPKMTLMLSIPQRTIRSFGSNTLSATAMNERSSNASLGMRWGAAVDL